MLDPILLPKVVRDQRVMNGSPALADGPAGRKAASSLGVPYSSSAAEEELDDDETEWRWCS